MVADKRQIDVEVEEEYQASVELGYHTLGIMIDMFDEIDLSGSEVDSDDSLGTDTEDELDLNGEVDVDEEVDLVNPIPPSELNALKAEHWAKFQEFLEMEKTVLFQGNVDNVPAAMQAQARMTEIEDRLEEADLDIDTELRLAEQQQIIDQQLNIG